MTPALPPLNRQTADLPSSYPERVVQFGGGNFLRAFVDWIIQTLNEQAAFASGVVIIKPTAVGSYDQFNLQEGLFHVQLHGLKDGKLVKERKLITCVTRALNPYEDYSSFLALACQPEIRFIVSNTTETGLSFNADDQFTDTPPSSFPAKLTTFLYHRFQYFEASPFKGCIILPCELVEQNGKQLEQLVLKYADLWQLEPSFKQWIENSNQFCNTLVDRIVVGFPKPNSQTILENLGFDDPLLVEGELYHSWVIEAPQSLRNEFPVHKTNLNIKIVDDVEPYRQIKVRILNGAHTSMTPLGYLLGLRTVREAVEHPWLGRFIETEIHSEIIPAFNSPNKELAEFAQDTLNRFHNPFIQHQLLNIALYSVLKFRTRLIPSLVSYESRFHTLPKHIVFALAALIRFYKGEWNGQTIPLNDEPQIAAWFHEQWQSTPELHTLVERVLANQTLWQQDLTRLEGLVDRVGLYLSQMEPDRFHLALQLCTD